jgi:hypothetical protein
VTHSSESLRQRRLELLHRSRQQREQIAEDLQAFSPWARAAEYGYRAAIYVRERPALAVVGVALLAWLGRRRAPRILGALGTAAALTLRLAALGGRRRAQAFEAPKTNQPPMP